MRVELKDRLESWADEGIISLAQAEAIRAREEQRDAAEGRSTLAAEAIGYLGAALAVVAGGLVVGRYWAQIEDWGRLTLAVTLAVVTFLAGWWIRERPGAAVARLVSLLWFATAAATAFAAGMVGFEMLELDPPVGSLVIGLSVTAVGGALYAIRRRSLQQIALLGGIVASAMAVLSLPDAEVDSLFYGLVAFAIGVAWFVLAAGDWLAPRATALVVGGLVAGVGLQVASVGRYAGTGITIALVTTAAVGVLSVVTRSRMLLAFGVAGTFVFVPRAVFHFFGDSLGAPFALFITGVVLIGVAVGSLRLRRELGEGE